MKIYAKHIVNNVQGGTSQQNFTWSPNGALVAHTLCYRSTVGILGSSIASAVMIVRDLSRS